MNPTKKMNKADLVEMVTIQAIREEEVEAEVELVEKVDTNILKKKDLIETS